MKSAYTLLTGRLSGGVAFMSRCCGAPADWSGRTELFQSTKEDFLAQWRELGSPQVILACSTCYEVFKTHLTDVPIISLWEMLDSLGLPESVKVDKPEVIAVHDACTTRHESAIQESVRNILGRLGYEIEELRLSRDKTECCGYGGLMFFANREVAKSAIKKRIEESPRDYVAYCAMCRDYFAFSGKRTLHLLDLIFQIPRDEAAMRKGPVYTQRHENRVRLKNQMLKEWWGETTAGPQGFETLRLKISEEVQQRMEERLILAEDVQQVIEAAERTGYKLLKQGTDHFLAHFRPAGFTYWVEYTSSGDEFVIHNAYSHRMEIIEEINP